MRNGIPKTFIQIHYHNKPGGVRTVMEQYARLFNETNTAPDKRNIMVCQAADSIGRKETTGVEIISCKGFNYHLFNERPSLDRLRKKLFDNLRGIVDAVNRQHPVWIIAHNLSLGKNFALSAAYADLARWYARDHSVRFFYVVHDFIEEGRVLLMRRLRLLESKGVPVWEYLYPSSGNVTYIVVNRRNYFLLKRAGFPVRYIPNPIYKSDELSALSSFEHQCVAKALCALSRRDGTRFNADAPTYFYPARVVLRKNCIEAVIVACLVQGANLILGGPGASKSDAMVFRNLKNIAGRFRLPVVFDTERISRKATALKSPAKRNPFEYLYAYASLCISTSIAEGFGYGLYEPWLFSKKVVGRLPLGISPAELIELNYLYTRLPIPISWISFTALSSLYYQQIVKSFGRKNIPYTRKKFDQIIKKRFIKNNCIDLGALDFQSQCTVLEKLCRSLQKKHRLTLFDREVRAVIAQYRKTIDTQLAFTDRRLLKNKMRVTSKLARSSFEEIFKECLHSNRFIYQQKRLEYTIILKYFSQLTNFRLLMNSGF